MWGNRTYTNIRSKSSLSSIFLKRINKLELYKITLYNIIIYDICLCKLRQNLLKNSYLNVSKCVVGDKRNMLGCLNLLPFRGFPLTYYDNFSV